MTITVTDPPRSVPAFRLCGQLQLISAFGQGGGPEHKTSNISVDLLNSLFLSKGKHSHEDHIDQL
jgi:hypothetical protein